MTEKPIARRLLVLDDSPDWGEFVSDVAGNHGFQTVCATNHRKFLEEYQASPVDVVVLDIFMPEKDGIEVIRDIAESEHQPFIILMSGQSHSYLEAAAKIGQAKGLDIIGTLNKPFRLNNLRELLQKAASLVAQKQNHCDEQGNPCLPRPLNVQRHGTLSGQTPNSKAVPAERDAINALSGSTDMRVRSDIAQINTQFCVALWGAHLATLQALIAVPSALAEAAAGVITEKADRNATEDWEKAVQVNIQTLSEGAASIREIANIHRNPSVGRSAQSSIKRLEAIAHSILAARATAATEDSALLAEFRKLFQENDQLRQNLSDLISAVKESLSLTRGPYGHSDSRSQLESRNKTNSGRVIRFPNFEV